MAEAKTESKSFLFHIGNEFPNMIRVTSEVGFYVKAFQLRNLYPDFCKIFLGRFSLTPTQQFKLTLVLLKNRVGHIKKDILVFNLIP